MMPGLYYAGTDDEIPDDDVARALQAGEVDADVAAGPMLLRDGAGNRISLESGNIDQLGAYLQQGFRPESAAQTADVQLRTDAARSPIQGGLESLAQGATLGLYGAAAGQLDRDYAEGMLARREALGGVGTGLEIAGAVIPTLISGGTLTPAGLVAKGAQLGGSALERTLVSRGVGAGLSRVAGLAAEGALDGFVGGVGSQLSEDSLGGTEITAERLAASGGLGALFGLGAGAAGGAAAAGARKAVGGLADKLRLRSAAVDDVSERAAKDAGFMRFVPDRVQEGWGDLVETSGRATKAEAREVLGDQNIRGEWLRSEAVKDAANKKLRDALGKVYKNDLHLRSAGAGEVHAENLADILPSKPRDAFKAKVESNVVFNDLKAKLEGEGVLDLLEKKRFGKLARDVGYFEQKVNNAFDAGDMAAGNVALANFKRSLWRHAENAARANPGSGFARDAERWVQEFSQDAEKQVRLLLEREDVFGQAGKNQALRNAAWRKSIDSGKEFNRLLSRQTERSLEGSDEWWRHERILDGNKVANQLNNLDNPNSEYETQIIGEHLEDLDNSYTQFRANGEIPKKQLKQFDEAHAAIREARQVFAEISDKVKKFNILDTLEKADKERSMLVRGAMSPQTLSTVGGFAGGGAGAALGALAGTVLSAGTSPGAMIREVTKLEVLANRVRGVTDKTQAKTARAIRRLGMPAESRRKLQGAAVRAANRYYGMSEREKESAARRVESRLQEYRGDATRIAQALTHQTQGMDDAPKLVNAYAQAANRAASFLESKLPPSSSAPNKLVPSLNKLRWTPQDLDKFTKYMAAIDDPNTVIDDLESGRVAPESIEAVRAVYPQMFADMQVQALAEIQKRGEAMPYDSVIRLSLMLDIEGTPLLNPRIQATMKQVNEAEKARQQEQAASPPDAGRKMQSPTSYTQRIAEL